VIEVINKNPNEDELKKMSRDEILANYNKRVRFVVHLGQAIKLTHYEQGKAIVYLDEQLKENLRVLEHADN
jgi:hypothetical protein